MFRVPMTRREALMAAGTGFGFVALAGLASQAAAAESKKTTAGDNPLSPKTPHFAAKAKRIIMLTMRGGPSHVDTFDYKPKLAELAGKTVNSAAEGQIQDRNRGRSLLPSPFKFEQHGQSGLPISELFPYLAKHADDLCLLNSMNTNVPNHPQSFLMLHTGEFRFTRPSMGAWLLYGLGSENQDLPGYITISPPSDLGGAQNYGNAFLPASFQATRIGEQGSPVASATVGNLTNPSLSLSAQRKQLDLIQAMNGDLLDRSKVNPELEGVISSYELGFRMQASLPGLMDLSKESPNTLEMYGIGKGGKVDNGKGKPAVGGSTDDFGRQCLLARRFAEAGVRFVEVCLGNWDTHGSLKQRLTQLCGQIDQPMGALLTDLKQRGLLKDTLVLWGGEFGRTPTGQGTDGRDHNSAGFSYWLAGGGVKGGIRYGATDETGAKAVENKMHHHDLHATILHLMGLDHQKLTFRYGGRDYSLTDIHGNVAKDIIA
jgi:hypothetical protein